MIGAARTLVTRRASPRGLRRQLASASAPSGTLDPRTRRPAPGWRVARLTGKSEHDPLHNLSSTRASRLSTTTADPDRLLTQKEAAALLNVSPGYLRESSCPKILLEGNGSRGKPLVRYLRSDVLDWALARRT